MNDAICRRLVEVAASRGVISYREVAELVGLHLREADQRTALSQLLRAISLHEHEERRPMLTAVVVSQDTNFPGRGFFRLARSLGVASSEDDEVVFERELRRVYEHWARATVST